jgi:hypothetical protein
MTYGIKGAAIGAGMGAVAIAYQPPPPSAGTLVATTSKAIGTHAAQFGAIAAVFGMTDAVTTAVMGNDWKAHAVAGCAAGTLMGAPRHDAHRPVSASSPQPSTHSAGPSSSCASRSPRVNTLCPHKRIVGSKLSCSRD